MYEIDARVDEWITFGERRWVTFGERHSKQKPSDLRGDVLEVVLDGPERGAWPPFRRALAR